MASQAELERNLKLYPWYSMALESLFWAPVFILLFASKFSISEVLLLESVYYIAVVILEVPSGYVSDRMGRRPTLMELLLCWVCPTYFSFWVTVSLFLLWPKC